jgi:hypothetical protein
MENESMTATVQRHGRYTLFETPNENRILSLGNDLWFAWVKGEQGDILVRSDEDHDRARTIQEGEYYLVDFQADPSFTDVPHLFLERDDHFQELILPNGLPTQDDRQRRVVETEKTMDRDELERNLAGSTRPETSEERITGERPGTTGEERITTGSDRELPIPDYDELSVRGAKPRLDDLNAEELRVLRAYEAENKKRKTLIHEIDRRLR